MNKIFLFTLFVTLMTVECLQPLVKKFEKELENYENQLQALVKDGVDEKGHISHALTGVADVLMQPAAVMTQTTATNLALSAGLVSQMMTELNDVALMKPKSLFVESFAQALSEITAAFLKSTKVARKVLDDYLASQKKETK